MNIFDIQNKQGELANKLHADFESCFAWNASMQLEPIRTDSVEFLIGAFRDVDFLLCLAVDKPFGSYNHFFSRNHNFVCGPDASNPSADCCSYVKSALACKSKEYPRCEHALDRVLLESYNCDSFLEREGVGIASVLVGLMACILCLTAFRRYAFSSLFKKNMLLFKYNLAVNVVGQIFGVVLLGALVGLITNNTKTVKSYVNVQDLVSDAIKPIKHKLAELDMKFLIETPDDHRFMLLEMFAVYGGLLFVVIFSHPLTVALSAVVHEKETRMKQVFKLTGVSEAKLTLSHNFAQVLFITPVCIVLSVMSQPTIASNHTVTQVFFFFLAYFVSMLSGFNIIAVFFTRQVHARMVAILVIYFVFLVYYVWIDNNEGLLLEKKGACLVSTMCFSLGMRAMVEDSIRGTGLSHSIYQYAFKDNSITVDEATTYMVYSAIMYSLLSVYLEKIVPQEDGYYLRPDFFLVPLYRRISRICQWGKQFKSKRRQEQIELTSVSGRTDWSLVSAGSYFNLSLLTDDEDESDEEEPESCESIVGRGVVATKLRKVFKVMGLKNNERVAVNDVDLSLDADEITVLLGPNGAGKTTLMHMLVGLLPSTSGTLSIFDKKIRRARNSGKIGWCPQFDILYPELTIRQHIDLFLALRRSTKRVEDFVLLLQDLDLWRDVEKLTSRCSLGQRRKLSLVLSLLGDTQFVVIDEVSSGVDPTSKVSIWNVLKRHVQGRVVLLSTHFMDEADVLGKKVVIMNSGKVICEGSPVELKNRFVPFYRMSLTVAVGHLDHVQQTLANYRPPLDPTTIDTSATAGQVSLEVRIPTAHAQGVGDLILILEDAGCTVKVESASLEDVLLSIPSHDQEDLSSIDDILPDVQPRWRSSVWYLLRRNWLELVRDRKSLVLLLLVPMIFWVIPAIFAGVNAIALLDPSRSPPSRGTDACQSFIDENGWRRQPETTSPGDCCDASLLSSGDFLRCMLDRPQCVADDFANDVSVFDGECGDKWKACKYVPWFCNIDVCCDPTDFRSPYYVCQSEVVFHNRRFPRTHRDGLYGPVLKDAFWNARNKIRFNSHCSDFENLGLSGYIRAVVVAIHVALGWLLPMSLILASVVREREFETKFHLVLNGMSRRAFWAGTFIWHLGIKLVLTGVLSALLFAFRGPLSRHIGDAFGLMVLFCFASIPFIYVLSYWFSKVDRALIVFFSFTVLLIGAWIFSFVIYILDYYERRTDISEAYKQRRNMLRDAFSVFPPFALIDGLFSIQEEVYLDCVRNNVCDLKDIDFSKSSNYLLFTACVAPIIIMVAEHATTLSITMRNTLASRRSTYVNEPASDPTVYPLTTPMLSDKHSEVSAVDVSHVSRSFGRQQVLQRLNLRLNTGEIFGILGRNGAGKSTLIRMVAGQLHPSDGQVLIHGLDVRANFNKMSSIIGYCPQTDALFDYLTVKEHLEMYATMKGVECPGQAVRSCIRCLELEKYSNVISKQLSGGNKRKLSVGIALIGNPRVILLDEASTGMDPHSQKLVKSVLKAKARNAAILLASHQLFEVESMCSRVGILKNGQLERTGTCASIKEALYKSGGQILNLQIRASSSFSCNTFLEALKNIFSKAQLEQSLSIGNVFTYKVHTSSLAKLFHWLAGSGNLQSYGVIDMSIAVTGLEDSFNLLVTEAQGASQKPHVEQDMKLP